MVHLANYKYIPVIFSDTTIMQQAILYELHGSALGGNFVL